MKFERLKFAHLPTTIESMPRLSEYLDGPELFIKRDDQTGLAFGGNKTRKLEYLLAEARQRGANVLTTTGAAQSNHCRQTAAAAARFGFECVLVLTTNDPEGKEIPEKYSGNLTIDTLTGAKIIWTTKDRRKKVLEEIIVSIKNQGKIPYLVPYGGSNHTGVLGYVNAFDELTTQCAAQDALANKFDFIVFASSSGGTQAGLVLGSIRNLYAGSLLGISVDDKKAHLEDNVADLITDTAAFIREDLPADFSDKVQVNDDYIGGGYGVPGKSEISAIRLFAEKEGLLLDPVYTGRAAAGMIDLVQKGYFISGTNRKSRVLFWHTGGTPVLFADKYSDLF